MTPMHDIQVITPMYRGETGAVNLNLVPPTAPQPPWTVLQSWVNVEFRVGDKVMQVKNNYDKGVFNGDTGKIVGPGH